MELKDNTQVFEKTEAGIEIGMDHNYSMDVNTAKSHIRVRCEYCGRSYVGRGNLVRHQKRTHGTYPDGLSNNIKCLEEGCATGFFSISSLRMHLNEKHGFSQMKEEVMEFSNYSDFLAWKVDTEAKEHLRFVRHHINKKEGRLQMTCSRSGVYKSKVIERKRRLKRRGSSKCGVMCTAGFLMAKNPYSEEIIAKVCLAHYGHDVDLKHVQVSKRIKDEIARQLQQGFSIDQILDTMRKSETFEFTRITRKDIQNVKYSYGLRDVALKDKNDEVRSLEDFQQLNSLPICEVEVTEELTEVDHFEECELSLNTIPNNNQALLGDKKQELIKVLEETIAVALTETDMDVLQLSLQHARRLRNIFEVAGKQNREPANKKAIKNYRKQSLQDRDCNK